MDEEVYEKYRRAGSIAKKARNHGAGLIKPGVPLLEIARKVESIITSKGAGLAFPVNLSVNHIAAHYSPRHDDTLVFRKGDVVKLDVGAHVDGYIADTAVTIEVGTNQFDGMIAASSEALNNAINTLKAGVSLSSIGKVIEDTITSKGYKPIDNLTGHSLERYCLHSGMSVPNVSQSFSRSKPKVGDVLAIEPFATNGAGHVVSGEGSNIFLCERSIKSKLIRDTKTKVFFKKISRSFKTLPFAQRWSEELISGSDMMLRRLCFLGVVKHYPQLLEGNKGIVTQKEHSMIVTENGCEVFT
jgi:methionyl aminopeptidase